MRYGIYNGFSKLILIPILYHKKDKIKYGYHIVNRKISYQLLGLRSGAIVRSIAPMQLFSMVEIKS
jgi:hypothetical protein